MAKDSTTTPDSPAAGVDSAQGTPDEPGTPAVGDLVEDEATGRLGILTADKVVLWLGVPQRHELPLRKVG